MAEVMEKSKKEESSVPAKADSKSDRPSNLCCYSQRICNLEKLKGFDFCHKHILEDKASPFKPCDFVAKSNGRRCPNPAPKLPDRGKSFCIIHTRKAELRRAVEERRKRRHHEGDGEESYNGDKEKRRRTSSSNSHKSDKLDGHSSDEEGGGSGDDYLKVDSAWHGDIDSDADSVDSEEEDPLKHAGVWTVEEATRMCRDKMIRLRSLYIAQFKRLQHVLKERKRKYCQAIQAEEEEETGECHLTPTQLLGRKTQHERPGTEALLHKQAKEKKQGTSARPQTISTLRCTYSPGGNRCTEKVLPLTKHCIKHITHDPNQLLFQKCAFQSKGDSQCERNVAKIFNHTSCRLHVELPPSMKRPDVKKDLKDAEERAKLRKTRALEQKGKPDVPEALQQKSSALVPPSITGQFEETAPTSSEAHQDTSSVPSDTLSAGSQKMDVDDNDSTRKTDGESKVSANSTCAASSSAAPSVASVSDPAESISPGLAAASLVAVCSSPQLPLQGAPLSSISGLKQSSLTDSKSSSAISGEQQSIGNAPSEDAKGDANSIKLRDATGEESVNDTKEAKAVERKDTVSQSQEMPKKDSVAEVPSEGSDAAAKQPEELNVAKEKEEQKVAASASRSASQTVAQGTAPVAVSQGTSSTSSNVILPTAKIAPQDVSGESVQVTSKSASQGRSNTSKVISPTSIKAFPLESSENPSKVTSKSASHSTSNILKFTAASTKVLQKDSPEEPSQVASKSASQSSSKGASHETHKTTAQGTTSSVHTVAKQTSLVASSVHPLQSTTASSTPSQPTKTNTAKPHITSDTPRSTPVKPFQHLPSGMTSSSSKQFSAITSVLSKESNKDSKIDLAKPKDQGDLGKL